MKWYLVHHTSLDQICNTELFVAGKSCDWWHSVSKRTNLARNFVATVTRERRNLCMLMKMVSY